MATRIRIARAAATVAAATLIFAETAAAAGTCSLPAEQAAIDARVLQSELMVGALTCGHKSQYNAFVQKFQSELIAHGDGLRHYFKRAYGGASEARLNEFVTRLANAASTRAMAAGTPAYCAQSAALFGQVLAASPATLRTIAHGLSFAGDSGIRSCAVQAAGQEPE
jgi:hypothetical protein